jgi:hypothetical protein
VPRGAVSHSEAEISIMKVIIKAIKSRELMIRPIFH